MLNPKPCQCCRSPLSGVKDSVEQLKGVTEQLHVGSKTIDTKSYALPMLQTALSGVKDSVEQLHVAP